LRLIYCGAAAVRSRTRGNRASRGGRHGAVGESRRSCASRAAVCPHRGRPKVRFGFGAPHQGGRAVVARRDRGPGGAGVDRYRRFSPDRRTHPHNGRVDRPHRARQSSPIRHVRDLLRTIPGISTTVADVMTAETEADMTVFPSPEHLASWAEPHRAPVSPSAVALVLLKRAPSLVQA